MRALFVTIAGLSLAGCPKATPPSDDAGASAVTTVSAVTSASAATSPDASASAKASFGGKYTVAAANMYVPSEKDWANVKFKNDESKHLGDGELSLAIDENGTVSGSTEGGPLGASIVEGLADGKTVTATIRRKDANDEGLTGTLSATREGDKIEGTMKLAEFNAAVVREAKVSLSKK
ncbi:MAG: hypothetical protein KF819_02910 [Labilithrix sp.]|nr:hypothetical protein [Labilithrix sp.]